MKIRLLKKEDEKAWEAYVNNHKNATIYHTLEWKKVLEDSYDTLKSLYLIAYDKEDKGKVIGVFPLFLVDSKLFGRRIESLPLSHYVDTLVNNKDINKKLINFASKLTKEYNTKFLEIRSRIQKNTVLKDTNQNYNTIIVPLNKDTNSVWYKLKKVRRKSIKKAEKCGVIIEERNDINSLKEFYKLLTKVRKKQGVPSYGFKFFENIRKHLFPKGYAKLYLAKLNKTTLFSLITFNYNNKIIAGYGMPNKDKN